MVHQGPYTNLHDLNIDWILQVIKEFNDKYHGIDDAIDAAIARLNATADELESALSEYATQLEEEATGAVNEARDGALAAINEIYSRFQTEANEAIQAIISNKEVAIAAIDSEMNGKLAQVSTLLNSLPHDYQDALNSMQIINATLNGTNNYPELVQGHYGSSGQTDRELIADDYRVTTLLSAGCASRKLRTRVTNANGIILRILYWTGWGDNTIGNVVPVSTSAQDEKTLFTYTFPANASYFTIEFASDYNMLNMITPSDLQVEFQWIFDSLETLEIDDETDISGNSDGFILSKNGDNLNSYTTGTEKTHMDVGHTAGTTRHYFKDKQARDDIAELSDILTADTQIEQLQTRVSTQANKISISNTQYNRVVVSANINYNTDVYEVNAGDIVKIYAYGNNQAAAPFACVGDANLAVTGAQYCNLLQVIAPDTETLGYHMVQATIQSAGFLYINYRSNGAEGTVSKFVTVKVAKTDATLSQPFVPADAKAVGLALRNTGVIKSGNDYLCYTHAYGDVYILRTIGPYGVNQVCEFKQLALGHFADGVLIKDTVIWNAFTDLIGPVFMKLSASSGGGAWTGGAHGKEISGTNYPTAQTVSIQAFCDGVEITNAADGEYSGDVTIIAVDNLYAPETITGADLTSATVAFTETRRFEISDTLRVKVKLNFLHDITIWVYYGMQSQIQHVNTIVLPTAGIEFARSAMASMDAKISDSKEWRFLLEGSNGWHYDMILDHYGLGDWDKSLINTTYGRIAKYADTKLYYVLCNGGTFQSGTVFYWAGEYATYHD